MSQQYAKLPQEDEKSISVSDSQLAKKEKPFPWKLLWSLYMVAVSDAVALGIMAPFVPEMSDERFGIDPSNVGLATGLLVGVFSLATFMSSFVIGHFSDVVGRKPFIMVGLISGTICTMWFGLSTTFWMAIISRFVGGLTNSNVALCKSVVSDSTKGKIRSLGFAYIGAAYSLARLISSAIGAATVGITLPLPYFRDNPFLVACAIGALINLASLVVAAIWVPGKKAAEEATSKKQGGGFVAGLRYIGTSKLLVNLMVGYGINSFTNGCLLVLIVLYANLPLQQHGAGFNSLEVGLSFAWFGIAAAVYQFIGFKEVVTRYHIYNAYKIGLISMMVGCFFYPLAFVWYLMFGVGALTKALIWIQCIISLGFMAIGFMMCLPVVGTMISNATPAERQGITQGVAQSITSLLRSFGPVVAGGFFSFSIRLTFALPFLTFWILVAFYITGLLFITTLSLEDREIIQGEEDDHQPGEVEMTSPASTRNLLTQEEGKSTSIPLEGTFAQMDNPDSDKNEVAGNNINPANDLVGSDVIAHNGIAANEADQ